jgi:protein O-mannosyl-transferase
MPVPFASEPSAQNPRLTCSRLLQNPGLVLGLVLVLASLVLYNPTGHDGFINYDDDHYVTNNPQVTQGLHWSTVKWAFSTTVEANWHPITWLSHELDWHLFHSNPAGHHYVSVLFQAINVWLLFLILLQETGFVWRSWMVAALFALHPINVESVAWIAERKNLLSMFFFLLALAAYGWYTRKPCPSRYVSVATLFALGLMSKPQVITFPFLLLLWDYWPLQRMQSSQNFSSTRSAPSKQLRWSRLLLEKIPLFALSAASAVITLKAQAAGGAVRTISQVPISVRFGNAAVSYTRYLQKAFWPAHLCIMYPYLWSWSRFWPFLLSLLLLGLVSVFVIAAKRRYLLVGWLWFLGTLVPMIGLVQVGGQAMADRYAYVPFIGIFIMTCWGVAEIARQQQWPAPTLVIPALIVLAALAVTAHRQLGYWSDNISLWSHAIQVTGPNFQAQEHLGTALAAEGRMAEATPHFQIGLALDPRDPTAHFNIALSDQILGRVQRAIEGYNTVLRMSPDAKLESDTLINLATAYHQVANDSQAETTYQAALREDANNYRTWLGMGLVQEKLGKFSAASEAFSRAAQLQPSPVEYLLLEKSLERDGRKLEAVAAHEKARDLAPDLRSQEKIAARLLLQ